MNSPEQASRALVEIGRLLYQRGMVAGTDGNLSVRLTDGRIVMSPSGLPKGRLRPDDMVIIDIDGKHLAGNHRASTEGAMHRHVYAKRPEINACVHSHATHATAFAAAGIELPEDVLPEVVVFVGRIPLTDYAPPGTKAVPASIDPFLGDCDAFLLRNHGLLTIGRDLDQAFHRHETVEHYARILTLTNQLGQTARIPGNDFTRLSQMRENLRQARTGNEPQAED